MLYKNNKLQPYVQHKGIRHKLEIMESRTPTLFQLVQAIIITFGKPIMAIRASFYKITGGYFAKTNVPWLKIAVFLVFAYVLSYKNLNLNFNLNSPTVDETPDYTVMSISSSLSPILSASFDDAANKRYIKEYQQLAIQEMKVFGIPASIKLGQALLESEAGESYQAKALNNHFNLKCSVMHGGTCAETDMGLFKEFNDVYDSWRAHSKYLVTNEYASLRKTAGYNYKLWAAGLKQLEYSLDKDYAEKLVGIIEYYELHRFDKIN